MCTKKTSFRGAWVGQDRFFYLCFFIFPLITFNYVYWYSRIQNLYKNTKLYSVNSLNCNERARCKPFPEKKTFVCDGYHQLKTFVCEGYHQLKTFVCEGYHQLKNICLRRLSSAKKICLRRLSSAENICLRRLSSAKKHLFAKVIIS